MTALRSEAAERGGAGIGPARAPRPARPAAARTAGGTRRAPGAGSTGSSQAGRTTANSGERQHAGHPHDHTRCRTAADERHSAAAAIAVTPRTSVALRASCARKGSHSAPGISHGNIIVPPPVPAGSSARARPAPPSDGGSSTESSSAAIAAAVEPAKKVRTTLRMADSRTSSRLTVGGRRGGCLPACAPGAPSPPGCAAWRARRSSWAGRGARRALPTRWRGPGGRPLP